MSYEKQLGPKKMLMAVAAEYPTVTRDPQLDVAEIWREQVTRMECCLQTMIWVEFNAGLGPGRRPAIRAARAMSSFYAQALADLDRKNFGRSIDGSPVRWIGDREQRRTLASDLSPGLVPWTNGWDPISELTAWLRRARVFAWAARGPVAVYGAKSRMKGKSALIVIVLGRELAAIDRASARIVTDP